MINELYRGSYLKKGEIFMGATFSFRLSRYRHLKVVTTEILCTQVGEGNQIKRAVSSATLAE